MSIMTTVHHLTPDGEITAVLRRTTRRTSLISARWMKVLASFYPELESVTNYSTNSVLRGQQGTDSNMDIETLTLVGLAGDFVRVAINLEGIQGPGVPENFPRGDESPDPAAVKVAFDWFQDEETDLWNALILALDEVNKPLGDPAKLPPGYQTQQELADPNSASAVLNGKSK